MFVAGNRHKQRGRSCNLPDPVCRHRKARDDRQIVAAIDGTTHRIQKKEQKETQKDRCGAIFCRSPLSRKPDHKRTRKDTCTAVLWFSWVERGASTSNPRSNPHQILQPREHDSDALLAGRIGRRKPSSASMKPGFASHFAISQPENSASSGATDRTSACRVSHPSTAEMTPSKS